MPSQLDYSSGTSMLLYLSQTLSITQVMLGGPYGMLGIEPELAAYKASASPLDS